VAYTVILEPMGTVLLEIMHRHVLQLFWRRAEEDGPQKHFFKQVGEGWKIER
jgi:hypothetical protein